MHRSCSLKERSAELYASHPRRVGEHDGHEISAEFAAGGDPRYDGLKMRLPMSRVASSNDLVFDLVFVFILAYIVEIVQRTREDHRVVNGASPRASQSLFKTGRAAAAIAGRNYVIPDDIKGISLQIISHRIVMKPEAKIRGITGMHIVRKILSEVPVPVIS